MSLYDVVYDVDPVETEQPTEQQTEQSTEQNSVLENLNRNIEELNGHLTLLEERAAEEEEVTTEEVTEESTEAASEDPGIVYLDSSADVHAYLSTEVENASINDLYTVMLSCRNIVLLMFLIFLMWKMWGALKNVISKIMNR